MQATEGEHSEPSLNSIRCGIQSHNHEGPGAAAYMMWSHFRAEQTSRAAAFITDCSLLSWLHRILVQLAAQNLQICSSFTHPRAQSVYSMKHFNDFFQNADSVHVVSSSRGSWQSQAIKFVSWIFKPKFFINVAVKSTTSLAHAVFTITVVV